MVLENTSIVISSYNRDDKVLETINCLMMSDLSSFAHVEVLVIDDGSPKRVEDLIPGIVGMPGNVGLRIVRQENSGIGATRNRGFREAKSDTIIFLDDDILVREGTIAELAEALTEHPGALIFGSYPFVSHESPSLERFAAGLYGYDRIRDEATFEEVNAITSGLLIVDRKKLPEGIDLYRDDMTIPAAEEHELIARFHRLGIPIYNALHISAVHNHHLELGWLAEQQYKYGLATAEAFSKCPELGEMPRYSEMLQALEAPKSGFRSVAKGVLARKRVADLLLWIVRKVDSIAGTRDLNFLFSVLATSYFLAGYREGRTRFGQPATVSDNGSSDLRKSAANNE